MLIVGAIGEVYIVSTIDGGRRLLGGILVTGQLVDGRIVAHHHAFEAYIVA